jgi:hypothetical protein
VADLRLIFVLEEFLHPSLTPLLANIVDVRLLVSAVMTDPNTTVQHNLQDPLSNDPWRLFPVNSQVQKSGLPPPPPADQTSSAAD